MNDWASVNEFRSVCRRLVEFEAMLPVATAVDAAPEAPAPPVGGAGGGSGASEEFDYHALTDEEL